MAEYPVGLDLGQSQDFTALAVMQRVNAPTRKENGYDDGPIKAAHYHIRHLERFRLGTPYPAVVERTQELLRHEPLAKAHKLVIDGTGVGVAVVDMFRQKWLVPTSIAITGGDTVTRDGGNYRVPKRDLVGVMQVLLQSERLKVAEELPGEDRPAYSPRFLRRKA